MVIGLEPLVEKAVNQHAGNGDIVPDGESPASPGAMLLALALDGQYQRGEHEWHNCHSQDNMRGQHHIIKCSPTAFAAKWSVDALYEVFMQEVKCQEND